MSVIKVAASKNSIIARLKASARRRHNAVSSATRIEPLENRRLLTATIGLSNPDNLPGSSRLIFDYIQHPSPLVPNAVHSQQTLQITDTGTTALTISSIAINGPWAFVPATASYNNVVVQPGAKLTITLAFTQRSLPAHSYNETNFTTTPNGGAAITGALTINSDDAATPSKVVTLAGYWQNESNNNEEPSLQTITNLLAGYQTNINSTPVPDLTEPISPTAAQYYGSEVVANSWEAANAAAPVALQELATFRTQGNTSTIYWYSAAQQQSHQLFTLPANQGQTLLPTLSNGSLAANSFTPGGAFGLRADNEYSTDAINTADGNTGGGGHHFRFFPLLDASGNGVPNSYLVAMDYGVVQAENFDFQDNVFVVSNIRPSGTPETPSGLTVVNAGQPVLSWNADTYSPVVYNVLSSANPSGPFNLLTPTPLANPTFTDTSNPVGTVYYEVNAEDNTQAPPVFSAPATITANSGPVVPAVTLSDYSGQVVTFNPLASATDATGTIVPATAVVSSPNHGGTATVNTSNGSFTYTPTANFVGTETFTYTVSDNNGHSSTPAIITFKVTAPIPVAPVANNMVTTDLENNTLIISPLAVDDPTTSFNVSSMIIIALPKSGTVTANPSDGTVTYIPSANFAGGDKFTYTIQDNNGLTSNIATVDINVGVEISSAKGAAHSLVYTDQNNTPVTISLNKGIADVYFDGIGTVVSTLKGKTTVAGSNLRARQISLSGTTAGSTLSITGKNKGQVNLGGVTDSSPLGSISAATTNLSATGSSSPLSSSLLTGTLSAASTVAATPITAAGTVQLAGVKSISLRTATSASITLGSTGVASSSVTFTGTVTDTSLTSAVALSNLRAKAWINSNTTANSESVVVTAPSIANMTIGGEFDAALTVNSTGKAPALGNAHVAGAVSVADWSVTGNARSIFLGAASTTWGGITVTGNLGSFVIAGGNLSADVSAGSINTVRVAGAITANITTAGNLKSLTAGQLLDSLIDVGFTAGSVAAASLANLGTATLGSLHLTSKAANTFNDSNVIAHTIGSAVTGQVNAANGGSPEGIAAHLIKGAAVGVDNGTLHLSGKTLLSNAALSAFLTAKGATLGTFTIDIL